MNVTGRINRILFILSYVSQNQGISVDALAEKVGMRPRQLIKELEFISLIGKPPFKPDDYVDIYVEENRVYIEFDQSLNRPIRFTRSEAVSLLLSLELLDQEVDPAGVKSLKEKIALVIENSVDAAAKLEDRIVLDQTSHLISDYFRLTRQAIEERRKLKIDYFSLTRNQTKKRTIRPYFLMKWLGYWYLTGFCELRKDIRTFKFERILSVELHKQTFPPPDDFNVEKYKEEFLQSMGENKIEIYFDSDVAPWIREQWGRAAEATEDGGAILTVFSETLEFPSRLVLGHAPHARPLSPPEFIEKVKEDAAEIIKLHEVALR
ncbi:MAG: WYL domain-containing protein [Acidobacteriota bacterium]|nr:MAG: WYL domain-containing protein [Acidobacteriota bacterium]